MLRALHAGMVVFLATAGVNAGEPEWFPVEYLSASQVEPAISVEGGRPAKSPGMMVRGVFPLGRQLAELEGTGFRKDAFEIIDFELQRQSMSGMPPAGTEIEWETVPIQPLRDVINSSDGITDTPLVPEDKFDSAIVAPLPRLAGGNWGSEASHPRLEAGLQQRLFRFIDFTVKPGRWYRYRVRLELRNPNFGKPTDDPFLAVGQTRWSPWSRPSAAIRFLEPQAPIQ